MKTKLKTWDERSVTPTIPGPKTCLISLTRGMIALIDEADYPLVSRFKWFTMRDARVNTLWYARAYVRGTGRENRRTISMHRLILGDVVGDIDHINSDGLDNRRCNLRCVSRAQNQWNRRKCVDNSTGFKGVDFFKARGKFRARVMAHGRRTHVGYFESAEDAAKAYDNVASRLHGEFARLNFPIAGAL